MVKALFGSLKHNYLYHKEIKSRQALTKNVDIWFRLHNEEIPHTAFSGETPREHFENAWNQKEEIRILFRHQEAIKLRIEHRVR